MPQIRKMEGSTVSEETRTNGGRATKDQNKGLEREEDSGGGGM